MIDPDHERLSIRRQCELVSISRASFYRQPAGESPENLELMRVIDGAFMETPWYGSRQMARHLRRQGWCVGRKRVRRLMRSYVKILPMRTFDCPMPIPPIQLRQVWHERTHRSPMHRWLRELIHQVAGLI